MHAKRRTGRALLCAAALSFFFLSMLSQADSAPPVLEGTPIGRAYLPFVVQQRSAKETPIPPDDLAVEQYIATQINQRRQAAGLPPLTLHSALTQAARRHCEDMAENEITSHTGSDGSSPWDRVQDAGYGPTHVGEIIAWGLGDAESAFSWWMNSPTHRAMVLSSWATDLGVGYARDPGSEWVNYWTVDFGREEF